MANESDRGLLRERQVEMHPLLFAYIVPVEKIFKIHLVNDDVFN